MSSDVKVNKNLIKALMAFNAKFDGRVKRNTTNEFKNYDYADLSQVWGAIRSHLEECGLMIHHLGSDGGIYTYLTHVETGESINSFIPIPANDNPQKYGSWLTYARRYAIMGLLNICPVDDDGEAAKPSEDKKVKVEDI